MGARRLGATAVAGSAQALPNGHTVIGFGNNDADVGGERTPAIVELDENNVPIFELRLPKQHWSYRVYRFERDENGWVVP